MLEVMDIPNILDLVVALHSVLKPGKLSEDSKLHIVDRLYSRLATAPSTIHGPDP
jgi:hypothetical protein